MKGMVGFIFFASGTLLPNGGDITLDRLSISALVHCV